MSSSPTAPASTTASSSNCPSRPRGDRGVAPPGQHVEILACGALAGHIRDIVARRGWPVTLRPLPAVLHNRPQKITPEAERAVLAAQARGSTVALAYADCGSYGALDELCARHGVRRLPGLHCYDVLAGADAVAALFEAEPGTYVLTDFLLRSFDRLVLAELGLDRHPGLWEDYFGHYTRLVWLAQQPTSALEAEADRVARMFGLPLTRIDTGVSQLERALASLVEEASPAPPSCEPPCVMPEACHKTPPSEAPTRGAER